ncbi:MAG TPA: hypothetical protein VNA19_08300 [Pyrinomonadaceae bacterium]|nr:hypothetical protein [Pyrinomonadaceae bacterium]
MTGTEGRKVAVQLDLKEWGELREDIYDNMPADERPGEPVSSLDDFESAMNHA